MAQDDQRKSNAKLTISLYVYTVFLGVAGILGLAVGMMVYVDPLIYDYFYVIRRSPDDDSMLAAATIIMTAGFISMVGFFLGCSALSKRTYHSMVYYASLILLIMLLELTAGFMVVAFKHNIHRDMKDRMRVMVTDHYEWDNEYGRVWNRVQVTSRCCGVDGSWDYHNSKWWYKENGGTELELFNATNVPDSCCKLVPNQDRDVWLVDAQNAHPKDRQKCNEDSAGNRNGSEYLNGRGCSAAFFRDLIEPIIMNWMLSFSLGVGFLQLTGLVCATLRCYFFRPEKKTVCINTLTLDIVHCQTDV